MSKEKKAVTTVEYKLYMYPEQPAAGIGFSCISEIFLTLEDARVRGDAFDGTNYEIQAISTTVEPPSKKFPEGETSISKTIIARKHLKEAAWFVQFQEEIKAKANTETNTETATMYC